MPSFRLAAAALAGALLLTACTSGTDPSGDEKSAPAGAAGVSPSPASPAPPSVSPSAEIPPNFTDEWLVQAFIPEFWGGRANVGFVAPSIERVADEPGAQAPFYGSPEVKGGADCERWAAGLRHAARGLAGLDGKAMIGGATYGPKHDGKPFIMVTAIMAARPPLLEAMAKDPLAGCRETQVRVSMGFETGLGDTEVKRTDYRWRTTVAQPLPAAAKLGDWSTAYRTRQDDDAWTWIKEVRFGPYLLQVVLVGYVPIFGSPEQADHIGLPQLDQATAAAYEHARRVLTGPSPVSTITYGDNRTIPIPTPS